MATAARRQPITIPRKVPVLPVVGLVLVGALVIWLGVNLVKTPYDFLEITLIGVTIGSVYALVALGYTLVYGILELINFAHGDVFMLGAMMAATITVQVFSLHDNEATGKWIPVVLLALLIGMLFCGVLNATIERIAYRPLRGAPRLAPLITAIGMSFILQNVGLMWKGANYVPVPNILPRSDVFSVGTADYQWNKLIVLLVTVPVLVSLVYLVQRTRQGKAMRATAQDTDAAAMMGINVNRTISFTFLIAGALAGAAGLLYALYVTNVRYDQGFQLGLLAFTSAVLGGIGNLPGAMLGGLVIGLIRAMSDQYVASMWTNSIVFGILILILVFRPSGLLGARTREKV